MKLIALDFITGEKCVGVTCSVSQNFATLTDTLLDNCFKLEWKTDGQNHLIQLLCFLKNIRTSEERLLCNSDYRPPPRQTMKCNISIFIDANWTNQCLLEFFPCSTHLLRLVYFPQPNFEKLLISP